MRQLVALTKMVEILRKQHEITKVFVQDPIFHDVEIAFLVHLGYTVLQDREAKTRMTSNTFLLAPHCKNNIFAAHLEACFPALCVGNDPASFLRTHRRNIEEDGWSSLDEYPTETGISVVRIFENFVDVSVATFIPKQ